MALDIKEEFDSHGNRLDEINNKPVVNQGVINLANVNATKALKKL